ncbi:hypothetical protein AURDEDRAFT_127213 [Auricularia subglabra TFB-10046 SS5]|nr:hypothetical protein AURDEDRAFT_127213 [Auricularia subglabra TFB-10046 SS5]
MIQIIQGETGYQGGTQSRGKDERSERTAAAAGAQRDGGPAAAAVVGAQDSGRAAGGRRAAGGGRARRWRAQWARETAAAVGQRDGGRWANSARIPWNPMESHGMWAGGGARGARRWGARRVRGAHARGTRASRPRGGPVVCAQSARCTDRALALRARGHGHMGTRGERGEGDRGPPACLAGARRRARGESGEMQAEDGRAGDSARAGRVGDGAQGPRPLRVIWRGGQGARGRVRDGGCRATAGIRGEGARETARVLSGMRGERARERPRATAREPSSCLARPRRLPCHRASGDGAQRGDRAQSPVLWAPPAYLVHTRWRAQAWDGATAPRPLRAIWRGKGAAGRGRSAGTGQSGDGVPGTQPDADSGGRRERARGESGRPDGTGLPMGPGPSARWEREEERGRSTPAPQPPPRAASAAGTSGGVCSAADTDLAGGRRRPHGTASAHGRTTTVTATARAASAVLQTPPEVPAAPHHHRRTARGRRRAPLLLVVAVAGAVAVAATANVAGTTSSSGASMPQSAGGHWLARAGVSPLLAAAAVVVARHCRLRLALPTPIAPSLPPGFHIPFLVMQPVQPAPQHQRHAASIDEEDIVDTCACDVTSALLEQGLAVLEAPAADEPASEIGIHGADDNNDAAQQPISIVAAILCVVQDALPSVFSSRAELTATLSLFRAGTPGDLCIVSALVLAATIAVVVLTVTLFSFVRFWDPEWDAITNLIRKYPQSVPGGGVDVTSDDYTVIGPFDNGMKIPDSRERPTRTRSTISWLSWGQEQMPSPPLHPDRSVSGATVSEGALQDHIDIDIERERRANMRRIAVDAVQQVTPVLEGVPGSKRGLNTWPHPHEGVEAKQVLKPRSAIGRAQRVIGPRVEARGEIAPTPDRPAFHATIVRCHRHEGGDGRVALPDREIAPDCLNRRPGRHRGGGQGRLSGGRRRREVEPRRNGGGSGGGWERLSHQNRPLLLFWWSNPCTPPDAANLYSPRRTLPMLAVVVREAKVLQHVFSRQIHRGRRPTIRTTLATLGNLSRGSIPPIPSTAGEPYLAPRVEPDVQLDVLDIQLDIIPARDRGHNQPFLFQVDMISFIELDIQPYSRT